MIVILFGLLLGVTENIGRVSIVGMEKLLFQVWKRRTSGVLCLLVSAVSVAQIFLFLWLVDATKLWQRLSKLVNFLVYLLLSWFVFGGCLRMSVVQTV